MTHDFDRHIERRHTESVKWQHYGKDVLPLWVADMDFRSPEPVIRALHERIEHGVFGYGADPSELREVIVERLARLYAWQVSPGELVFLPGVVTGFNLVCHALASPGDGVLVQTPVYYPILNAPSRAKLTCNEMELTHRLEEQYEVDVALFEKTITDRTRVFILCNPHNPVGRVFRHEELEQMAEACLCRDIVICSDEIHCDLVFPGHRHTPIASLAPEVADQAITLMAPSKTFNIPGLHCSFAIVQNQKLRKKLKATAKDLIPEVNILGYTAALAAYSYGQPWLDEVLCYLETNRDFLARYVAQHLPGITMAKPEGTYLAWLDCREVNIPGNPHQFFLDRAEVAVSDGAIFGHGGEGFVRLNFGCPRSTLVKGLDRMREALSTLESTDPTRSTRRFSEEL